jgi:protein-disulfide isomerase
MTRQRLFVLIICTLTFLAASWYVFGRVWQESHTRFRVGLPVPKSILPSDLLTPAERAAGSPPTMPDVRQADEVLSGATSSKVTLMVFGDFQSDLSRQQSLAVTQALNAIGPGLIRTIWRDLPDPQAHSRAVPAAIAARCAAQQGKFGQMHQMLMTEAQAYDDLEFLRFARRIETNEQQFTICMHDPANSFHIQQDIDDAANHGITSVPTIFINGDPSVGYLDSTSLTAALRGALKQAAASQ